jgi:hypothetical protein
MKTAIFRVLLIAFAFTLLPLQSVAQEQPAFVGDWQGEWSNPDGHIYIADMQLTAASDGSVLGKIQWTLKQSPLTEEQSKLGKTGVEFVSGSYDPGSRVLTFEGISKTDPDNILGLDKYKLLLADNSNVIGGITWNNGNWRGVFSLTRSGDD